jgi:hypothetical protein
MVNSVDAAQQFSEDTIHPQHWISGSFQLIVHLRIVTSRTKCVHYGGEPNGSMFPEYSVAIRPEPRPRELRSSTAYHWTTAPLHSRLGFRPPLRDTTRNRGTQGKQAASYLNPIWVTRRRNRPSLTEELALAPKQAGGPRLPLPPRRHRIRQPLPDSLVLRLRFRQYLQIPDRLVQRAHLQLHRRQVEPRAQKIRPRLQRR